MLPPDVQARLVCQDGLLQSGEECLSYWLPVCMGDLIRRE